jgi:hypothetical protein
MQLGSHDLLTAAIAEEYPQSKASGLLVAAFTSCGVDDAQQAQRGWKVSVLNLFVPVE